MDIRILHQNTQAAKSALHQAEAVFYQRRNRVRQKQNQLAEAQRLGEDAVQRVQNLERELQRLQGQISQAREAVNAAKANLFNAVSEFPQSDRPWELVKQLSDRLPFLLFPVRIETRFITVEEGRELWVCIFPDDIAVDTHEETLTEDELQAGKTYWRERWSATQDEEDGREHREMGAWRALVAAYGSPRAAWIARQTKPESLDVSHPDDLSFPDFDPEALKPETWSQAPRTQILPDRFVVMTFSGRKEIHRQLGNLIPQPLILGPDPQKLEDEYRQEQGELLVGEDIEWIYNFDKAVEVGMGVRIPLDEPYASQGFDRILVLGLRLSADAQASQVLLEDLFNNHHYAPDGMSFLPQGTPTNNTDRQGAGFSRELDAETSYSVEQKDILFDPTSDSFAKTDGQRLAEALGIRYAPFQHIRFADREDVKEAIALNKALWSGTLGYFFEELLELDLSTVRQIRQFFTNYVTGRGMIPAVRTSTQPYGILLTSDFSRWQWSRQQDGQHFDFLNRLAQVLRQGETQWQELASEVPHVGASGDPYQNLLRMLGLHATSVEYHRRHAVGEEYIWNYEVFNIGTFFGRLFLTLLAQRAQQLLQELGYDFEEPPKLFDLAFFLNQDDLTDPLVDNIPADATEKWSETQLLKSIYKVPDPTHPENSIETNYLGWLLYSNFETLKRQRFENLAGERQPIPRPLLYRLLRGSLLQAYHDASLQVYTNFDILSTATRREVELVNIEAERTVTRWEFIEADVSQVIPDLSSVSQSMGQYLQTEAGRNRPEASHLQESRVGLETLLDVPTARLERLLAEHLDLCSYRLDAWQMGCFYRRLQQQRYPVRIEGAPETSTSISDNRELGIYLGAYGWLENLQPAPELVPVDWDLVPPSLRPEQGSLFEQPGNGGFIHGPSLNHAVTAAVLRNAYLTHFDAENPEKMAVNLSSQRVRTALSFLDGIRNGQDLSALLGYQFERGLHDNYGDLSLNQYIPLIRQQYPLIADKITPDESDEPIEVKEARHVLDGYALVETAFLKDSPEPYPYRVEDLPDPETDAGKAIQMEVSRMADILDAIADLALAEGVYQVTQGNYDRAGAMLKVLTEGSHPPEPEIVRTPRSGAPITQRVTLHFETGTTLSSPWPGSLTERAKAEPGLNRWLGQILPDPNQIQYLVQRGDSPAELQSLASLELHPIDLLYLISDDLSNETTELETRIAYINRRDAADDSLTINIEFMAILEDSTAITLFELLPLLRHLRNLITGSRPLGANDFRLPSEVTTNPAEDANFQGYDLVDLRMRLDAAITAFEQAVQQLNESIPPLDAEGNVDVTAANGDLLRNALLTFANLGVPNAIPVSAIGETEAAKRSLIAQAVNFQPIVRDNLAQATKLKEEGDAASLTAEERSTRYRKAVQYVLGSAFNLIPQFIFKNLAELQAAVNFRANLSAGLMRHHVNNPYIVEEWFQGVARVRENINTLEAVRLLADTLNNYSPTLLPLQLPYRETDYWMAVEYPEVFVPQGEFLSLVQLPGNYFDVSQPQSGLLVDEWIESIPGKQETTGIAVHYDQPSMEPPQTLLLAVTPEVTGNWSWDKLIGILNDTLDRAKQRAVEPNQLDRTAYAHLLPAVLSAVTSYPFATITTDFIYQTAIEALNLVANEE